MSLPCVFTAPRTLHLGDLAQETCPKYEQMVSGAQGVVVMEIAITVTLKKSRVIAQYFLIPLRTL